MQASLVPVSTNTGKKLKVKGDLGLPRVPKDGRSKKLTNTAAKRVAQQVAVLDGMGLTAPSIGQQLGISSDRVKKIRQDIRANKNGLRDYQQAAMAEHFPTAKALADKLYKMMDKGADIYDQVAGTENYERGPSMRELAYGLDIIGTHVLYPKAEEVREVKRTSLNIDLKDPTVLKQLVSVMRGEQDALPPAIDVTPKKEE